MAESPVAGEESTAAGGTPAAAGSKRTRPRRAPTPRPRSPSQRGSGSAAPETSTVAGGVEGSPEMTLSIKDFLLKITRCLLLCVRL